VPLKEKTDQEKLEDQGYKCGKAGVDSVICTKTVDGVTTTRTCDLAGRCTSIKIIDPNPNKLPPKHDWKAKPVTGAPAQTQDLESQSLDPESQQYNKENVASPSEVLGAISSSDPDSSGEDTETSVDSSVGQQSEGSTTEAVR
jgi:hypothetical protein